jgi:hypothetical protein
MVREYYDPREPRPEMPQRRNAHLRQSTLSVALEALGGGLIIAIIVMGIVRLMT